LDKLDKRAGEREKTLKAGLQNARFPKAGMHFFLRGKSGGEGALVFWAALLV